MKTHTTSYMVTNVLFMLVALMNMIPVHAQDVQQNAIYCYRNDGDFDAFLHMDVDSITFSCIDLDSVVHEDVVVQEVWTPYQVYRIPIVAIDSIAFRAPEKKYCDGVFFLTDDHVPYITNVDTLNIMFDASIPEHLCPSVGNVVVSETSEGLLEDGFAGRVIRLEKNSEGLNVLCEEVELNDIFDQFLFICKCATDEEASDEENLYLKPIRRSSTIDIDKTIPIELPTINIGDLGAEGEESPIKIQYQPKMDIACLVKVQKNKPAIAKITFQHSHALNLHAKYELKKEFTKEWWFKKKNIRIHIPIKAVDAVIKPYVNFGAFIDINGKAEFEYTFPMVIFKHTFGMDYNEEREDRVQFINDAEFTYDDPTVSLSLDGSLAFGLAIKLGANLIHQKLLNFESTFHAGPKFVGHFDLNSDRIAEDANAYRQLKTANIQLYGYVAMPKATYKYFGSGVKLAKRGTWKGATWSPDKAVKKASWINNDLFPDGLEYHWYIHKWYIVPHFDAPFVTEVTATSALASLHPFQDLLIPVELGVAFKKYGSDEVIEKDFGSYWGDKHNANSNYSRVFEGLEASTIYKVYPTVKLLGIKMDAEPSADYGVSDKLVLSSSSITINIGETAEVMVLGGSGRYSTIDDDSGKARSLSFNYNQGIGAKAALKIFGVSAGDTFITILDVQNGSSVILYVHVVDPNYDSLALSTNSLTVNARTSNAVKITSGSGSYAVESDKPDVVSVELYDTTIAIEAYKAGTATITVKDTKSGQSQRIVVTVVDNTIPKLSLSSQTLDLINGYSSSVLILSGSGKYTAVSDNTKVAICSIVKSEVIIEPVGEGECTITVTDTETKESLEIDVKVYSFFTCPDNHHPHLIDLGLPSGTKWACCNVGATKPEEYGGYYAWGETEKKEVYNWSTYIHCDGTWETCHNLGSDISGTQYDVAHVKWGGKWCMPTLNEIKELLDNCTTEWTTLNGVNGRKFTSKINGNSIFLPAAGGRWDGGLHGAGEFGYYWSSTQHPDGSGRACGLYFRSGYALWDKYSGRSDGRSVRPVVRN